MEIFDHRAENKTILTSMQSRRCVKVAQITVILEKILLAMELKLKAKDKL